MVKQYESEDYTLEEDDFRKESIKLKKYKLDDKKRRKAKRALKRSFED